MFAMPRSDLRVYIRLGLSRLAAPFPFTFIYSNKNNPNLAKTDSVSWLAYI
jgi:hypothetical protein